jgi:hypothetical protein
VVKQLQLDLETMDKEKRFKQQQLRYEVEARNLQEEYNVTALPNWNDSEEHQKLKP